MKPVLVLYALLFAYITNPSYCQGFGGRFTSGISGMIDTAMSIHSATTSMTNLLSNLMTKASEAAASGKREGDDERYRRRNNYYINPFTRSNSNTTNQRHIPTIWDMASESYLVEFMLYNRGEPDIADVLLVPTASKSTTFDKTKKTKLVIHDFNQTYSHPLLMKLKDAYLHNSDYNVILADWIQARKYSYTVAARVSEYLGVMCARLLIELEADLALVHVIGFGLGAHAAGVMGFELNGKVGRITGLDPALPLFRMVTDNKKLDTGDALFVDVYHSDGGDSFWHANHLGMGNVMGHVDVYINQGIFQPGCPTPNLPSYEDMYCSHIRSLELFVESAIDRKSTIACSCDSWMSFRSLKCDCASKMTYVGDFCPKKARGMFYLVTRDKPPYAMGRRGAFPVHQINKLNVM